MNSAQRPAPSKDASLGAALEALKANRPLRTEEICRAYLETNPGCVEHLRMLGNALSKQGRYAESEQTVRLAMALQPDYPHLHEDLGSVLALQQRFEEAVPCFERAIQLEPRLPLAHKKLGQALAALGRGQDADAAFEEFFEQDSARGQVALALNHLRAGRKAEAIDTLRSALRENDRNVDAMRFLAHIYWQEEQQQSDAEALLRRATTLAPGYAAAWVMLGMMLHEGNRDAEAIECYRAATRVEPDNAVAWAGLGTSYADVGNTEQSIAAFERSLALSPNAPNVQMGYGHVLKTHGDQQAALRAYRAAIAERPDFGEVYWSMANLKVFRFEESEIAAMERQLERDDLAESADIHFRFALAKANEDKGDYARAWHYYDTGNQRQRSKVSHDPVAMEMLHEKIAAVFTRELFERHAGHGCDSAAPIFIVGLPRSGSTLIEQILASHSQVEGTAELHVLMRLAYSIGRYRPDQKRYPESVVDLRSKDLKAYGRQYMDETRPYRVTDRPFFTDKGQNFTYDMADLSVYYRQYYETMKHWHKVLPGKVLDVHYEETVTDFETQVRRILAHCGLPFEEACLRFHENRRPVKTASSEQVRRPIYTDALGHWRHFEPYLGMWQEDFADILEELPPAVRNAGL
jgi:tetratricopeptide (TPR) repeat protein